MANGNRQKVNDIAGDGLMTARLAITSAQVLALFTTPLDFIPAPPAGFYIVIIESSCTLTFNTTAYAVNQIVQLITNGANVSQTQHVILNATLTTKRKAIYPSAAAAGSTQLLSATKVVVNCAAVNPTLGDSDIIVYASYRILQE